MIFFDNASTTRAREECAKVIEQYCFTDYFNPSTLYTPGVKVAQDIKERKESILAALSGRGRLIFTSGGTESDNLAILGLRYPRAANFIFSPVEHAAVYQTANYLKQSGYEVRFCACDGSGRADIESILALIDDNTALVSVMHVCNETGAINDIGQIAREVKRKNKNIFVHSDGVQALGKLNIDLDSLGVDLYSLSAHKINAPKGIGALFVKEGVRIFNIMYGGGQEYGIRPSTQNVAGIAAFALALELAHAEREQVRENIVAINEIIRTGILETDSGIRLISDKDCAPNILTFASNKVRGEVMLHALSKCGILVGTGSACSSSKQTHRIPQALRLRPDYRDGILRLSFGRYNTKDEAREFLSAFDKVYSQLAKTPGRK
ncbi:MAG: cysteine desulfurase family protein [Christensenellales bacterium]|jgi:cysteine desulfurase